MLRDFQVEIPKIGLIRGMKTYPAPEPVMNPLTTVPVPDLNVALRKTKGESGYGPGNAKSRNLTLTLGTLALWN